MPCDVICDVTDATMATMPWVVMIESLSAEEQAQGVSDLNTLGPMLDMAGIPCLPYPPIHENSSWRFLRLSAVLLSRHRFH